MYYALFYVATSNSSEIISNYSLVQLYCASIQSKSLGEAPPSEPLSHVDMLLLSVLVHFMINFFFPD